ncbi:hypothetical protein GCM10010517_30220 [Streptosporangium fragile]|uniref:Uncharacterized protein n=1 Tax=Streptosporangium fragile TaxID=46186 RepID=A0ABN3VY71_9ACTN
MRRRRKGTARLSRALAAMLAFVLTATLLQGVPAVASAAPSPEETKALNNRLHALNMRLHSPNFYKNVVLSSLLVGWSKSSPGKSEEEIVQDLLDMSNHIDGMMKGAGGFSLTNAAQTLGKLSQMVSGHPKLAPAATALSTVFQGFAVAPAQEYDSWQNAVAANQLLSKEAGVTLDKWNGRVAGDVRDMAEKLGPDNPYVKVWNGQIGFFAGITANATTEELLADPQLKSMMDIEAILQYQKNDERYKQEIVKQLARLLERNNGNIRKAIYAIDGLQNGYDGAFDWRSHTPPPPPSAYETALEESKKRQEDIDAVAQGIGLLTTLIGFADEKAAKQAAGVGAAAIRIATAVNEYLPKIAGKGIGKAIFSMGTAALTGNVISAISDLLPLFQAGQPTPEQLIMEQLGQLRQEVANLHNAMNEQFSRVNEALNVIYGDMMGKFDEILKLQQATVAQLTQIQGQLQGIQQSVDTWAAEIIKSLQNTNLKDARAAMNRYIGYEKTYGKPIPTLDEYAAVMNELHFSAVTQAREEPFVPSPSNYLQHEGNPVALLDTYEASGGADGFLSWYGKKRHTWPAQASNPPNLAVWLTMAHGYVRMAMENQNYAKQIDGQRTADIVARGLEIESAARELSKPLAEPRADGTRTNDLFTGLTGDYKKAVADLSEELKRIQKEVTDGKGYRLFGTADQALPAGTTPDGPATVPSCAPTVPRDLARPSVVSQAQLPNAILMALYAFPEADRPTLTLCHTSGLTNEQSSVTDQVLTRTADLSVVMKMQLTWPNGTAQTYRTWSFSQPLGVICRTRLGQIPPGDTTVYFCNQQSYYLDRWVENGYKKYFEAKATVTSDEAILTDARDRAARFLTGRQKTYYDRVVSDLTTAGKPLFEANAKVTRAMRLLQAYTRSGWATALGKDEIMQTVLTGAERLPSDVGGDTVITDVFRRAKQNYEQCAPSGEAGSPCTSPVSFDPFVGQSHQWLLDCTSWYGRSRLPVDEWTADPIGNTVLAFARYGTDVLRSRYEQHSKELVEGLYTEGVPQVKDAVSLLQGIDGMFRVPAA